MLPLFLHSKLLWDLHVVRLVTYREKKESTFMLTIVFNLLTWILFFQQSKSPVRRRVDEWRKNRKRSMWCQSHSCINYTLNFNVCVLFIFLLCAPGVVKRVHVNASMSLPTVQNIRKLDGALNEFIPSNLLFI